MSDPKKNAKLSAAHYNAVAEGLAPDSSEYFDSVETFIGIKGNGKANGHSNGKEQPKRKASVPVAPVQQSGGVTSGNGTEVRLNKSEAQAATDGTIVWNYDDPSGQKRFKKGDPVGVQEFARRKAKMTAQGLYDRSFSEQ